MKIEHLSFFLLAIILIIIILPCQNAFSSPGVTVSLGAGYSDNLYADSFSMGNSYLYNGVGLSSTHFKKTRLKLFYDLTYYEYDTNNLINNFLHSPGMTIYRALRNSRFKWNLTARGYIKKYSHELSTFDNNRIRLTLDASYFLRPGFKVKGGYQGEISTYVDYDVLENARHHFEIEAAKTLPSRTTINLGLNHNLRSFEEGNATYNWTDIKLKIAQSINARTGLSVSYMERVSSDGSRPLSTFYIVSGVSTYWDSWNGRQAKLSLKRILPSAILSRMELLWWDRKFNYDQQIAEELPWLEGKNSRNDNGFAVYSHLRRQFNLNTGYGKYIAVSVAGGYSKNSSDDDYYSYGNYYIEIGIEYSVF